MRKYYELGPFTIFDVETTGMSAVNDRIVEIAALRVDLNGEISRYQTLVNPNRHIPSSVSRVNHIVDDMVADAPHFRQIGYEFLEFARNSTLVAHNARFDLAFLQESLSRNGLPLWQGRTMDSIVLLKKSHSGLPSYSLQNLRAHFRLDEIMPDMQAHRAGADVEWTHKLFEISLTELLKTIDGE
ncbi:MAG: 3'-5' exonuclease [Lentisphaeria bacterium]|nr:3'-5' exonuclease [Lentisphaeria bacterium]